MAGARGRALHPSLFGRAFTKRPPALAATAFKTGPKKLITVRTASRIERT